MAHYIDGFVVPVPVRNLDAYRQMAELAAKVWMERVREPHRAPVGMTIFDDPRPRRRASNKRSD